MSLQLILYNRRYKSVEEEITGTTTNEGKFYQTVRDTVQK
jgi:hypothetical protein